MFVFLCFLYQLEKVNSKKTSLSLLLNSFTNVRIPRNKMYRKFICIEREPVYIKRKQMLLINERKNLYSVFANEFPDKKLPYFYYCQFFSHYPILVLHSVCLSAISDF